MYWGEFLKKGGTLTVCRFKGGRAWQKEEGGVFEGWGGDTPMHTMQSTYEKITPKDQCNERRMVSHLPTTW